MSRERGEEGRSVEWRDGFLFVGNQLALDFLNTKLANGAEEIELLPDAVALRRWLAAAGIDFERRTALSSAGRSSAMSSEELAAEIRAFRERLREAIFALEAGQTPATRFVKELNRLLFDYPQRMMLFFEEGRVMGTTIFEDRFPERFWGEIAFASAAVLSGLEQSRVRKCEHCVVHFLDTSKKGSRRWCSMNLCGNRVKVAAYQDRKRTSGGKP